MQQPQAYHCFLHQQMTCVKEKSLQALVHFHVCACVSPGPTVFMLVLDNNMVHPRCHVSPHARSTVALAQGVFILLCVGLFIVTRALSQMCNFIALLYPPALVHMTCSSPPPPPPLHTRLLQRAAVSKHIEPKTPGGFCHVRSMGSRTREERQRGV